MLTDHVLFSDSESIILNKRAGEPVAKPKRGGKCLEDRLDQLCMGFVHAPLIVHRLDQDTSGCLLLARHPKALKRFNQAFSEGRVAKTYWAVLSGEPLEETGMIDLPLAKRSTREQGWWMTGDPTGKAARTGWRVLHRHEGQSLVEFSPENGRTHQLRVHAKEGLAMPIVGDPVYGSGDKDDGPMLLHARWLSLPRENKDTIEATAELPEHFPDWAKALQ